MLRLLLILVKMRTLKKDYWNKVMSHFKKKRIAPFNVLNMQSVDKLKSCQRTYNLTCKMAEEEKDFALAFKSQL